MGKFFKARWWSPRSWMAIALFTFCILLLLSRFFSPVPSFSKNRGVDADLAFRGAVSPSLQVDSERLWHYLTHLPSERFEERDRLMARTYITQTLESAGWAVRQQEFTIQNGDNKQAGVNIIAEYPELSRSSSLFHELPDAAGDMPTQHTLLIGAHYDTVQGSSGADDNGTGIAAVLELAQLLRPDLLAHDQKSLALKFVLFDLEESGLWGSEAFVADVQERQGIAGAIILEMLGYTCHTLGCQTYPPLPIDPPSEIGDFLAVVGDRDHPHLVERFQSSRTSIPIYTLTIPTLGPLTPDLLRSDHVPFWRKGIGAVMVTDTANFRNPHYHQASDRPEALNPGFFTEATQAILDAIIS